MRVFQKNIGSTDKTIRLVAGLGLAGAGLYVGAESLAWAIGLGVVAVVLLATAFASSCPLYIPFGISTHRVLKRP